MNDTGGSRTALRYDANKKTVGVAYALWFFLGIFGAHRFYLGASGTGAAILVLTIVSILLSVIYIGLILLIIPVLWVLIDAFLIPGLVRDYNNKLLTLMGVSA
jgi:TM2 domain-containing membrane protein YozV